MTYGLDLVMTNDEQLCMCSCRFENHCISKTLVASIEILVAALTGFY